MFVGGIATWAEVTAAPSPVFWTVPFIQISYPASPEPTSLLAVQVKVGAALLVQSLAAGETSTGGVGGLASTRTLQVDVDWVVVPPLSRATTYQVCQPSVIASASSNVYVGGLATAIADFFKTASTYRS